MAVTHEQVNAILGTLEVKYHHFPGTKCVVAAAHAPDGYVWGQGWASALPSTPFDLERGKSIALKKAMACAEDNIWEKLGFLDYENNKQDKSEEPSEPKEVIPFISKPLDLTDGGLKCCLFGIDGVKPQAVVGRRLHITRVRAIHVSTRKLLDDPPVRLEIPAAPDKPPHAFNATNHQPTKLFYQSESLMSNVVVRIGATYDVFTGVIDLTAEITRPGYYISKIELDGFYD